MECIGTFKIRCMERDGSKKNGKSKLALDG